MLSRTRRAGEKIKIGGLALNTLKKLKGERFGFPASSMVEARAIGRGATAESSTDSGRQSIATGGTDDEDFEDTPELASRPWDTERDGNVIGEGAGAILLESEEAARRRGARLYARVAGYHMACAGGGRRYSHADPDLEHATAARAVRGALAPTVGFMVQIIKGTSLAYIIGFHDLMSVGKRWANASVPGTEAFLIYPLLALFYFALCFPLSTYSRWLESRLGSAARSPTAA